MEYRKLEPKDLNGLIDLGLMFAAENYQFRNNHVDPDRVRAVAAALLADQSGTCIAYGAFDEDKMVGFILGEIIPDIWSSRKVLSDHAFYVAKDYRGEGAGSELMLMFKRFAKVHNADLRILISGGVDDARSIRVMDKLGFERRGYLVGMEA